MKPAHRPYRGRIAPSPTGLLHLGHARTFWMAWRRSVDACGTLVFRNEDLDRDRCQPKFINAMYEDLRWLGLDWQEGPDVGGPCAPYSQNERGHFYLEAWQRLKQGGFIYPCTCSRKDLAEMASAPHDDANDELIYPGKCRPTCGIVPHAESPAGVNWRFRVPDSLKVEFIDLRLGLKSYVAGHDFGDFLVWRRDGLSSYQLAVVVDDAAMRITEVVRGEDLLKSTARQIFLFRALGLPVPAYFHCPLLADASGVRLAKRHDALSLQVLRAAGRSPESIRSEWEKDWPGLR